MAGEPGEADGGTRGARRELPTASLERAPLGPTRGNLIGEKSTFKNTVSITFKLNATYRKSQPYSNHFNFARHRNFDILLAPEGVPTKGRQRGKKIHPDRHLAQEMLPFNPLVKVSQNPSQNPSKRF